MVMLKFVFLNLEDNVGNVCNMVMLKWDGYIGNFEKICIFILKFEGNVGHVGNIVMLKWEFNVGNVGNIVILKFVF